MKQGVFIERDGILNQVRVEGQHQVGPLTLEELRINKAEIEDKRPVIDCDDQPTRLISRISKSAGVGSDARSFTQDLCPG